MDVRRALVLLAGTAMLAITGGTALLPMAAVVATRDSARPTTAPDAIPPRVLSAYRAQDGRCPGLRWQLLAGIGAAETGHGRPRGASVDPATGEGCPTISG